VKVAVDLKINFNSEEDARNFYQALIPDFKDFDIKLEGTSVRVRLSDIKPSRARALMNSLLRTLQLYEELERLTT